MSISILLISASQSIDDSYQVYLVDGSSDDVTLTLPDIDEADGTNMHIKRVDGSANDVIIAGYNTNQTIDGQTSVSFAQNQAFRIASLSGVWHSITDTR